MKAPGFRAATTHRTPRFGRSLALLVLVAGTLLGMTMVSAAGVVPERVLAQESATPVAGAADAVDRCPDELTGPGSEAWVRAELYFSQPGADADAGTDEAFMDFLDNEVTPRFPDGLTLLSGIGQWRGSDGDIGQTRSHVLIILFPSDSVAESSALLEEIRDTYEDQFDQQSVLRADAAAVCTSF
ncbi:MAG: DUF3574 domain-containing protein [Chloroflexota bacterium]|nr:DUF3574 domain-containing protein [Chloroflexota bacterium]